MIFVSYFIVRHAQLQNYFTLYEAGLLVETKHTVSFQLGYLERSIHRIFKYDFR